MNRVRIPAPIRMDVAFAHRFQPFNCDLGVAGRWARLSRKLASSTMTAWISL